MGKSNLLISKWDKGKPRSLFYPPTHPTCPLSGTLDSMEVMYEQQAMDKENHLGGRHFSHQRKQSVAKAGAIRLTIHQKNMRPFFGDLRDHGASLIASNVRKIHASRVNGSTEAQGRFVSFQGYVDGTKSLSAQREIGLVRFCIYQKLPQHNSQSMINPSDG